MILEHVYLVILCQNGFAYVWQSNGKCIDHTVFMRSFEQRIKDNFQQKCFSEINISNRCILYKAIDRRFVMAKYLLCVHINSNRKALCRLRLSSPRLFIERGKWKWIESVHYAMKLKTNIMSC